MEQRRIHRNLLAFFLFFVLIFTFSVSVEAYKNYTVGDSSGWYDKLENPKVDYQKWVAGKNFSLGDFLIFNTDNNHSVVQTYNLTTYNLCDFDDSEQDDTIQWSSSDPNSVTPHPVSVAVPLVKEGMTYFFSSDYDGEQCKNGQHFMINVTHGQGLPDSLKDPSDEAPAPVSSGDEDNNPTPDIAVPSNFNNPKEEEGDVKATSGSASISMNLRTLEGKLNWVFVLGLALAF
ncbi:PREDICTED: blue copper protein-like [Nelumbo nucifera]|uniref:Blue copper protein-like n=1 Tax=Nelumbo nucifera TaxID=4432 RepID=A0A1U7ZGC2_NELNU|nr:PREDICTED: blue copper protein-like [Nelumbo nucifera]